MAGSYAELMPDDVVDSGGDAYFDVDPGANDAG